MPALVLPEHVRVANIIKCKTIMPKSYLCGHNAGQTLDDFHVYMSVIFYIKRIYNNLAW